ncbi:MAG: hypothetical protein LBV13_01210, partial [Methanomassiliicoccaceae archaeon]|nr:hypothetical protein [Methanomassiliicoccaceae archaeon]
MNRRKLLSVLAISLFVAASFTLIIQNANEDGPPDGWISSPDELKDQDYFDENGYIPISTAAELQSIGKSSEFPIDGKYYLTNDLEDVGAFTPIGSYKNPFKGVFDGNGYAIYGMNISVSVNYLPDGEYILAGLFANVADVEIRNLGIVDSSVTVRTPSFDNKSIAGVFVGLVNFSVPIKSYLTMTDCYSENNIVSVNGNCEPIAGGIVGSNQGNLKMERCYSTSSVESFGADDDDFYYIGVSAGGLLGRASCDTKFIDCYNTGDVSISGMFYSFVGGLFGYNSGSGVLVENCYNTGTIDASGDYFSIAGGLLGHMDGGIITVTDSGNTGDVEAFSLFGSAYAGGMIGNIVRTATIAGCDNSGSATAVSFSGSACAGGILSIASGDVKISDSCNSGSIEATAGTKIAITGGILGWLKGASTSTQKISITATISDSYNEGNLTAVSSSSYSMAGGIFGYISGSAKDTSELTITANAPGCYNTGMLSVTSPTYAFAGGILAYSTVTSDLTASASSRTDIRDSYNAGDINASAATVFAGGIVAYAGTETTVANCYSRSAISIIESAGDSSVGGIIAYADEATIENCYYLAGVFNVNDLAYDAQLYSGTAKVDGNDDGTPREG